MTVKKSLTQFKKQKRKLVEIAPEPPPDRLTAEGKTPESVATIQPHVVKAKEIADAIKADPVMALRIQDNFSSQYELDRLLFSDR